MKELFHNTLFDRWCFIYITLLLVDMLFKVHFDFHSSFFAMIIELCVLFFFNFKSYVPKFHNRSKIIYLLYYSMLLLYFLMFIFQIAAGEYISPDVLYDFFNCFIFIYFAFYSKIDRLENIGFAIKLMTLLGCFSILLITRGDTSAFWRRETLIDKGFMTIFFAISQCLCITDIIFKNKIWLNLFFLIIFFYINMFFVQSKTSFVAFGLYLLVLLFLSKRRYRIYALLFLIVGGIVVVTKSDVFISESIAYAVNNFFNNDIFSLDATAEKRNIGSFEARSAITYYCLTIFWNNPLWGIGIGGYKDMGGFLGVTECESSYLDMLVEGGLLYFIPVFANIIIPLIYGLYYIKCKSNTIIYQMLWAVSVLTCILVCFYWNDFLHPFAFALIGMCCYAIFCNTNLNKSQYKTLYMK